MKSKPYNILIFFLLFINLKGLGQTFGSPDVFNEIEPEILIFDPHYDKDGNIEYYSFGDIIKVKYEYDVNKRPIRKSWYVLDKYDYNWEKTFVTEFRYKGEKLVEEQTSQFYGSSDKPLYIMAKSISYNAESNTDTIRIITKKKSDYINLPDYGFNQYTVRYLNRFNQPDSLKIVDNLSDNTSFYTKIIYSYDKERQIKSCEAFRQFDGETQELSFYSFTIKRSNNRIEYIQKTMVPDFEDDDFYWNESPKFKEEVSTYIITSDSKKRITSKLLTLGNETILDCKYSYTIDGQTDVNSNLNVIKGFEMLNALPGISKNILRGMQKDISRIRYTTHNKNNAQSSVYYLMKEQDEDDNKKPEFEKKMEINTQWYPDYKNILSLEFKKYDDGELDDHEKAEYKYRDDGFVEKTMYDAYRNGDLEPDKKIVYKENQEGKTLYKETFSYQEKTKKWKPQDKKMYKYDEYGFKSYEETYSYEDYYYSDYQRYDIPTWVGKYWVEWKRDAESNILEEKTKRWVNGEWQNNDLNRYTYSPQGEKSLTEEYSWNKEKNSWQGNYRDSIVYDSNGNKIIHINYKWLPSAKKWEPYSKIKDENSGDNIYYDNKRTRYKWINNQWLPQTQTLDTRSDKEELYAFSEWNEQKKEWIVSGKKIEKRDKGGYRHIEEYSWDYDLNELTGIKSNTTMGLGNQKDYKITYRKWDNISKDWQDTLICNRLYAKNAESYVYEIYDKKSKEWKYNRKVEETVLSEEQSVSVQSLWNAKANNWMPDRKIIYYYKESSYNSYKSEIYIYDTQQQSWTPVYSLEESKQNNSVKNVTYYKWGADKSKWVAFVAEVGSVWPDYYLLNETTGKLQKQKDDYKARNIIKGIKKEYEKLNTQNRHY